MIIWWCWEAFEMIKIAQNHGNKALTLMFWLPLHIKNQNGTQQCDGGATSRESVTMESRHQTHLIELTSLAPLTSLTCLVGKRWFLRAATTCNSSCDWILDSNTLGVQLSHGGGGWVSHRHRLSAPTPSCTPWCPAWCPPMTCLVGNWVFSSQHQPQVDRARALWKPSDIAQHPASKHQRKHTASANTSWDVWGQWFRCVGQWMRKFLLQNRD